MKQDILQAIKYCGGFFGAFVLPVIIFTVFVTDVIWWVPFIVCPPLTAAAAWFSAGKENRATKWVKWGAVIGLIEAILIVATN